MCLQRQSVLLGPSYASLLWDVATLLQADGFGESEQAAAAEAAPVEEDVDVLTAVKQEPGSEAQEQAPLARPHPATSSLSQAGAPHLLC